MSSTPSNEEISRVVHEILGNNDLQTITLRMVMTMICKTFSLPKDHLTPQKAFVRSIIRDYIENSYTPQPDEPTQTGTKRPAPVETDEADDAEYGDDGNDANDGNDDAEAPEHSEGSTARTTPTPSTTTRPATKTPRGRKPSRAANGTPALGTPKPVKLTGLEKPVVLAQPLADFFGDVVIPRSKIPGRISAYAKEHRLQDPADGRRINCDAPLKAALNVDTFTFFSLAKIIAGLVYKPEECDPELQELARACEVKTIAEKVKRIAEGGGPKGKPGRPPKKQKVAAASGGTAPDKPRKPSGLLKPMQLSEALVAVVGESQLPRSEVLKQIWVYIRTNGLKDPKEPSRILCDEKLMAVFDGSESVTNMGINKFLSAHMSKIEET